MTATVKNAPPSKRSSMTIRRLVTGLVVALSTMALAAVVVVVVGLVLGYRPVVILTGSMGETAPPRSLIIAEPRDGDIVDVGDIVVMRRPEQPLITHRVIEVEANGDYRFAITQGDANEAPDAAPYPLRGEQLVARWIQPRLGHWALTVFQPGPALAVVALATLVIAVQALRWIWVRPTATKAKTQQGGQQRHGNSRPAAKPRRRKRAMALAAAPLATVFGLGVAWAFFTASDPVPGNTFGTAECFDARLGSVQNGETIHAVNGTVTVPITTVDPTKSFVMSSIRSASNNPPDSTAVVRLAADGSAVELERATDAAGPPPIVVAWSVVSYDCGVTVQRGTSPGSGSPTMSVPITAVNPAASFATVTTPALTANTEFSDDDLYRAHLGDGTAVSIESASALTVGRSFHWQVISFDDPADVTVQNVNVNLAVGVLNATTPLPSPVAVNNTFLLTGVTSDSTGIDIGERMVRTRLLDGDNLEVTRLVGTGAVDLSIQVVSLNDGTTVHHGVVDFAPGETLQPITVDPFDPSRSTAISTVAVPGPTAGGQTDLVADDVVGEGTATFVIADGTTVNVERAVSVSNASFAWQVIEWAGPTWVDPAYRYRQRIDVEAGPTAAPGGYTVPVEIDHQALVDIGASLPDGTDVRLMRWDGTMWVELDRILDDGSSWNTTTTTLLFQTDTAIDPGEISNYWLYFGNDTPPPVLEDPENVFLLTEDFETGTLGDFEDRTAGTLWYSADPWTQRIPITIGPGQVVGTVDDFPVLVSVTEAALASGAQADGSDIRFTADDGTTTLDHEIESFDAATGSLEAWVKLPLMDDQAGASLYLLFGAANAPDQQNIRDTWPSSLASVWHLSTDPAGPGPQLDDSTINNNDGLNAGSMTGGNLVAGQIGNAVDFDGIDDRLTSAPIDLDDRSAITASAWARPDALVEGVVLSTRPSGVTAFELATTATGQAAVTINSTTDGPVTLTGGTVTAGSWHHLASTWDGSTLRLYLNGAEAAQQAVGGSLVAPAAPVTLGAAADGADQFDGLIDEARLGYTTRSADWIANQYANQANPATFASLGPIESGSWFDVGPWAYRKPVVIEAGQVSNDFTDFVFYLEIDDADIAAGAQATGADLVVTAADGVTRLDHVTETYDGGSGAIRAWVRIPTLAATSETPMFVYYGNATAVDQQDPEATFGPNADLQFLGLPS